jgi:hypothetical protein
MFGVTGLIGMAVGPIIAETIIRKFSFFIFFLITGGMGTLGLLLHIHLPESHARSSRVSSQSFFSILLRGKTLTVALLALLFGFGLSAFIGFASPFAREQDIAFISLYYISYSGAAVLTRFLGGDLRTR